MLWLLLLAVMLAGLGAPAVRRTQEARVLEAAREMMNGGPRAWLIPHLNGQVRLQKPPLAYWASALSFKLFGVTEFAGRLPAALAGWLTVGLTFCAARWLFGARAAWFAASALATSYLFFKHMQLAETDSLVTLFVSAAMYFLWRAATEPSMSRRQIVYQHLGSAAVGLAALSKGPPALFPILFLLGLAWTSRRWKILSDCLASGGPLTLLLIAAPWFIYAAMAPEAKIIGKELHDVLGGEDHHAWFFVYFPLLLYGTAPWSGFVVVAVVEACLRRRLDSRLHGLLLWNAAICFPLCVTGNKQVHYLLPLIPGLMLLVGWFIDEGLCLAIRDRLTAGLRLSFWIAALLVAFTSIAMLVAPRLLLHHMRTGDIALAIALAILAPAVIAVRSRKGMAPALTTLAIGCAFLWPVMIGQWMPSLNVSDTRTMAQTLQNRYGNSPIAFLGDPAYLPLCFAMRREIPVTSSIQQLPPDANLVVLVQIDPNARQPKPAPALPPEFLKQEPIGAHDQYFEVFRRQAE